jgi:hypothetical protein
MTLKIERAFDARETRIRLSGQLRSEHLRQVRSEVKDAEQPVVLDLEEVDLVDVDGVRFLNECESTGVSILRCSPYIREWMLREQGEQANTK